MKYFSIIVLFLSSLTQANNLSLGIGLPYGGAIGTKYSIDLGDGHLYAGLGMMAYSSDAGATPGYVVGYEYPLDQHHVIGLLAGKVSASTYGDEFNDYQGAGLTYSYYFSGFNRKSWILGASYAFGRRDLPDDYPFDESQYDREDSGAFIILGYQFN